MKHKNNNLSHLIRGGAEGLKANATGQRRRPRSGGGRSTGGNSTRATQPQTTLIGGEIAPTAGLRRTTARLRLALHKALAAARIDGLLTAALAHLRVAAAATAKALTTLALEKATNG